MGMLAFAFVSQRASAQACARPTDIGGYAGYAYADDPASFYDTDHVRVWYTKSGTHATEGSSARPDGVPDVVAHVGAVAEEALRAYASWGYLQPRSDTVDATCASNGGDARLDLYLVHFGAGDGAAVTQGCVERAGVAQCATFLLVEANLAARYPSAGEGIETVVPHEVFHAVQNAYNANTDRYWAEGTAQWSTHVLYPSLGDLERFLPAFFRESGRALDAPSGGVTSSFLYGTAIWPVFLAEAFGPETIREVFETLTTSRMSALDATRSVTKQRGLAFETVWSEFWAWNATTGIRHASEERAGYTYAERYPLIDAMPLAETVAGVTSGATGSVFRVSASTPQTLTLTSSGVHQAHFVPLIDGKAMLSKRQALPVVAEEGLVVLTSHASSKVDAPYQLELTPLASAAPSDAPPPVPEAPSSGGCGVNPGPTPGVQGLALLLSFIHFSRKRLSALPQRNQQ